MATQMKVLIAYDGSPCADAAIDDLKWAGLPEQTTFRVVSVVEHWLPPPSGIEIVQHLNRSQEYQSLAKQAASRVQELRPGWQAEAIVAAGAAASEILEIAEEWRPDLIVMGAHGLSALGRFFFGSVSQKVLHEASCAVRIGRKRPAESGLPPKLIIGFDGSASAKEAVRVITAREWPAGCEVRLVYAAWPSLEFTTQPLVGKIADWIADEELKIKRKVDAMVRDLNAAGLPTQAVIKSEEPKRLLLMEAEEWKADCIFVGARGLSQFQRFRMGSVSSAVAARAQCTVEVVRTVKTESPAPEINQDDREQMK